MQYWCLRLNFVAWLDDCKAWWKLWFPCSCGRNLWLWIAVGHFQYVSLGQLVSLMLWFCIIVSVIQTGFFHYLTVAVRNVAVKLHCSAVTLNARVEIVEICSVSAPINIMPLKLIICILVINWHINYSYTLYLYFSLFCGQLGKLKKLSVQK